MLRMRGTALVLVLLLLAMPLVFADTTLFDGSIGSGQSDVFYDSSNVQNTVLVQDIDHENSKCLINIGGVSTWVGDDEVEISDFEVEVEDIKSDGTLWKCEFEIKPKENPNADVRINSLKVLNVEPDNKGFYFVEDGTEVKFLAEITSDVDVDDLYWLFFDNGYPDGIGASTNLARFVDLEPGLNELEFSMVFRKDMDKTYGTGSFITVLVLDPEGRQTVAPAGSIYHGISIYVGGDTTDDDNCHYDYDATTGTEFIICEAEPYQKDDSDETFFSNKYYVLEEGETEYHYIDGTKHAVKLLIVEDTVPASATFEIDGEVSSQMGENDIFYGEEGLVLRLHEITLNLDTHASDGDLRDIVSYQLMVSEDDAKSKVEILYPQEEFLPTKCNDGCFVNHELNKCLPMGTRLEYGGTPSYCGVDGNVKEQKEDGSEANNNYECKSNSARYGVCENIKEQQSALKKIFGWLSRIFGGN